MDCLQELERFFQQEQPISRSLFGERSGSPQGEGLVPPRCVSPEFIARVVMAVISTSDPYGPAL